MRENSSDRIFRFCISALMLLVLAATLLPLLNVVSTSLVSAEELGRKRFILLPDTVDFGAYRTLFSKSSMLLDAYAVTLFRVAVGTLLSLLTTYGLAYGLATRNLPGRTGITLFVFITMLFNGGMIPYYITIRSLGLMNSIWVYIYPMMISAWNAMLLRNFIMNIPDSLNESAELDGANEAVILFRIIFPLSLPAMATIGLFYAVGQWNSWWDAYLFVSDSNKQPVQLLLRNILSSSTVNLSKGSASARGISGVSAPTRSIQTAAVIVSTVPVLFVYPFLQKYFVKGVMVGSVKG